MAMVSTCCSPIGCLIVARLCSGPCTIASSSSAQLTSALPPSIRTHFAITHKLVASQCPLLFGVASPALWALVPMSSAALASEQIVESAENGGGTVESTGIGVGVDPDNISLVVRILGTAAFIGLVLLTTGIIYLAVSDFLDKRTREAEAKTAITDSTTKKKQKGSISAAKGSAKGFGKKLQDDE